MISNLKNHLNIKDSLYILKKESRGIASRKPIKKDEIIISIPYKFLLTAKKIPYYSKLKGLHQKNSIFAYFLYKESKKKKSDWHFYLKTLPSKESIFKNFPFFLKDNIIDTIKRTKFAKELKLYKKEIEEDYNRLEEYFKENIDWKEYIYFRIIVTSRIFSYNSILYMVPYIDLLNHSKDNNTRWYYKDGNFQLQANQDIPSNEEITDSYGNVSNLYLYLYYGFTLPRKFKSKKFSSLDNEHLNNILR